MHPRQSQACEGARGADPTTVDVGSQTLAGPPRTLACPSQGYGQTSPLSLEHSRWGADQCTLECYTTLHRSKYTTRDITPPLGRLIAPFRSVTKA
eukprot:scaffold3697_cov390-Prasinococcus_capsulatus_cf.AAC.10